MNRHLSPQESAESFSGQPLDPALLSHLRECLECRAELDRFGETVLAFRGALREVINAHVELTPAIELQPHHWAEAPARGRWQWAVAAAVVVLAGLLPIVALDFTQRSGGRPASEEVDPSVLMDSINLHLSRDLPAPMEPIMVRESGGIQ
jgi:hypothetical protein